MIEVVESRTRQMLAEVRESVRVDAGWLLVNAGLAGLASWMAVHGVADVPVAVWWVLTGAAGGDAWGALRSFLSGWRELRRLRRDPAYMAAVAELDAAYERTQRVFRGRGEGGWAS